MTSCHRKIWEIGMFREVLLIKLDENIIDGASVIYNTIKKYNCEQRRFVAIF